jgi:hypothetical protein
MAMRQIRLLLQISIVNPDLERVVQEDKECVILRSFRDPAMDGF